MPELQFVFQPGVYSTPGEVGDLGEILDSMWGAAPAGSTVYAASAFVDQNGVLPFVKRLKAHSSKGGFVRCFFGASPGQAMASRQAVTELLNSDARVFLLNRKKIFHSKLYGVAGEEDELVVSSGNFTGNGLALNIESSVRISGKTLATAKFTWKQWERRLTNSFEWYEATLARIANPQDPAFKLTFDETHARPATVAEENGEGDEVLVYTLNPTDVNRIQDPDYTGTAYFWLSRYSSGYFPPLQMRSRPGAIKTFSADINVDFLDIGKKKQVRVTFEAYNNLDFRLGVGPLRATGVAAKGDMAVLDRVGHRDYRLRIIDGTSKEAKRIRPYLIHKAGHRGKRYGMVPRKLIKKL